MFVLYRVSANRAFGCHLPIDDDDDDDDDDMRCCLCVCVQCLFWSSLVVDSAGGSGTESGTVADHCQPAPRSVSVSSLS